MPHTQLPIDFGATSARPSDQVLHLRDEIARAWSLPLGKHVEVTFHPAFPMDSINGVLELRAAPAFPWDPHQPLALRVAGNDFSTRDIARWRLR